MVLYRNPGWPQNASGDWPSAVLDDQMDEMTGVAAADFNQDGLVDVVALTDNPYDPVGGSSRARVAWYRNEAAQPGRFSPAIVVAHPGEYQRPWSVEASDLDLDGDPDLLVACVNHVDWFENLGGGLFSSPRNISTASHVYSKAADLDRDGSVDVVSAVATANRVVWFRNTSSSSISGRVFNDLDRDGRADAGEPGLGGRTLYVDLDNDKVKDANEASAVSDASGRYTIGGLKAGYYNVRQVLPAAWYQSSPRNDYGYKVTLATGRVFDGALHGAYYNPASIGGGVFNDLDADGIHDADEPGIAGRAVYIDLDNDKVQDGNEPAAVTGPFGTYKIGGLGAGYYNLRQVLPDGWVQSLPHSGYGVKVTVSNRSNYSGALHGAYVRRGSISGRVFNDLDRDGRLGEGEPGLAARVVYADLDNDRRPDSNEPWAISDSSGRYTIKNLLPGYFNFRQALPDGWVQSAPSNGYGFKVNLGAGQNYSGALHGAYEVPLTASFSISPRTSASGLISTALSQLDATGNGEGTIL